MDIERLIKKNEDERREGGLKWRLKWSVRGIIGGRDGG